MSVIYYSNFCDPSKKLLQKVAKTKLSQEIHFICIDQRKRDSKGNTILFVQNEQVMLPPNVTKVPALYQLETKQVLFGDDIYDHLLPREVAINQVATNGNGDPDPFSIFGMSRLSDAYSYWDQSVEDLSAKGHGGTRQMHKFAALEEQCQIVTPKEDHIPDKVGSNDFEKYKAERDALVKPITRI
uniref:Uncharacterized protein n=1 Tax=viral metagenome TaxID=1070528 RepID=A0A6C0HYT9_9ZZZZ